MKDYTVNVSNQGIIKASSEIGNNNKIYLLENKEYDSEFSYYLEYTENNNMVVTSRSNIQALYIYSNVTNGIAEFSFYARF
jgi:hypothetical protein